MKCAQDEVTGATLLTIMQYYRHRVPLRSVIIIIIIIIILNPGTQFPGNEKIRYAIQKSTEIKL